MKIEIRSEDFAVISGYVNAVERRCAEDTAEIADNTPAKPDF